MSLLILIVFIIAVCIIHNLISNEVARLEVLSTWMIYLYILWMGISGSSIFVWFHNGWLKSIGLDPDNYFILMLLLSGVGYVIWKTGKVLDQIKRK